MAWRSKNKLRAPKRLKPPVRIGKVSGTVRLDTAELMDELRHVAFARCGGHCEAHIATDCQGYASWFHGHLAHILGRGAGGGDTKQNTVWACAPCHILSHSKGIRLESKGEAE